MTFARMVGRIALIGVAAVVFMGLTGVYAGSIRSSRFVGRRIAGIRRPAEPRWSAAPKFVGEGFLIGLVAIAGRKLLRLRLDDRSPV